MQEARESVQRLRIRQARKSHWLFRENSGRSTPFAEQDPCLPFPGLEKEHPGYSRRSGANPREEEPHLHDCTEINDFILVIRDDLLRRMKINSMNILSDTKNLANCHNVENNTKRTGDLAPSLLLHYRCYLLHSGKELDSIRQAHYYKIYSESQFTNCDFVKAILQCGPKKPNKISKHEANKNHFKPPKREKKEVCSVSP